MFAAVINKLIKEMVPNIRVSTDARDLILNCCSGEYKVPQYETCNRPTVTIYIQGCITVYTNRY